MILCNGCSQGVQENSINVAYMVYGTGSTQRASEVEAMAVRIVSRQTCVRNVGNNDTLGFCFLFVLKKQSRVKTK